LIACASRIGPDAMPGFAPALGSHLFDTHLLRRRRWVADVLQAGLVDQLSGSSRADASGLTGCGIAASGATLAQPRGSPRNGGVGPDLLQSGPADARPDRSSGSNRGRGAGPRAATGRNCAFVANTLAAWRDGSSPAPWHVARCQRSTHDSPRGAGLLPVADPK